MSATSAPLTIQCLPLVIMSQQSFTSLATSRLVAGKALKVSLVVGTILVLINHGDKMLSLSLTSKDVVKMLLCYLVPYSVSTWSAVGAIRASNPTGDGEK